MMPLTKTRTPQPKKIFFRMQTTILAKSFELLTGSLALTRLEESRAKLRAIKLFLREPLELNRARKC